MKCRRTGDAMSEAEALEVMNMLLHHGNLILALDTVKTAHKS